MLQVCIAEGADQRWQQRGIHLRTTRIFPARLPIMTIPSSVTGLSSRRYYYSDRIPGHGAVMLSDADQGHAFKISIFGIRTSMASIMLLPPRSTSYFEPRFRVDPTPEECLPRRAWIAEVIRNRNGKISCRTCSRHQCREFSVRPRRDQKIQETGYRWTADSPREGTVERGSVRRSGQRG